MSEEKKDGCCSTGANAGGCCGTKKLIVALVLGLIVFTCGYLMGKGGCPFAGGGCHGKMCPLSAAPSN